MIEYESLRREVVERHREAGKLNHWVRIRNGN